jgi:DNA-binding IclR family transcriptional regulator
MSDIAAKLELEKGPAHRVLAQLCEQGWAEQDEQTSQYRLTLKLSLLGQRYLHGLGLPDLVQPILDEIAAQCHELVRLTVVSEGTLAWLAASQGAAPGLMYSPSMHSPIALHATSVGKAWLAAMSNDEAIGYALRGGLGKPNGAGTSKAITSVDQLMPELEVTRQRGYGLVVEEAEPGVVAMAVTVRSLAARAVVGTVSIAGPVIRISPEHYDPFIALLREASAKLAAVWPRQSVDGHVNEAA